MDDIKVHTALEKLVSACGRVESCDRWDVHNIRSSSGKSRTLSVGIVLLVVRNGKLDPRGLDDLAHRQAPPIADTEVGLT